jgi:histidine triad (HIT) family protein
MTNQDCIFCKIAAGEIPAKKILETANIIAFEDINPQAPVHFLIIPKKHIPTLDDVTEGDAQVLGEMLIRAAEIAKEKGIAEEGYRQIINCREAGGQIVLHLHLHIMGGRPMSRMG